MYEWEYMNHMCCALDIVSLKEEIFCWEVLGFVLDENFEKRLSWPY